jgi:hypothetical protein
MRTKQHGQVLIRIRGYIGPLLFDLFREIRSKDGFFWGKQRVPNQKSSWMLFAL